MYANPSAGVILGSSIHLFTASETSDSYAYWVIFKVIVLFAFTSQSVMTWKDAVNRIKSQYNDNIPEQMVLLDINNKSFEQIYLLLTED